MLPYLASLNTDEFIKQVEFFSILFYSGSYGNLCAPKSVWHDGATYITGYKDISTNNSPVILRWKNGVLELEEVGTIDFSDALQHQHPAVLVIDNFIYVFAVNGHGRPIKIWKSNTDNNISDGFTLHHTITGNFGYCNPRMLNDGRVTILSRWTGSEADPDVYSQLITISEIDDLTTWTNKLITDADHSTTDTRHYPAALLSYGTNTWYYGGISLRGQNSPITYYGQAIWKTQDFITFYNIAETFSKDIDTDGALTPAEIEANFMIIGSNTAKTTYIMPKWCIVINDVVYGRAFTGTYFEFFKIATDGTISWFPCTITGIDTANNFGYKIDINYNGANLIIKTNGGLYTCDLNFDNMTLMEQYLIGGEEYPANAALLPSNFPELTGDYIFGGSSTPEVFPYFITDNKYLL